MDWLVVVLGFLAWLGIITGANNGAGVVYFTWLGIVVALYIVIAIRIVLWIINPRPLVQKTRLSGDMDKDISHPSTGY